MREDGQPLQAQAIRGRPLPAAARPTARHPARIPTSAAEGAMEGEAVPMTHGEVTFAAVSLYVKKPAMFFKQQGIPRSPCF